MIENVDIKTGYKVPEGYFEDFASRMSVMASQKTASHPKKNILRIVVTAVSSAAAVIILVFGIFKFSNNINPIDVLSSVSSNDIITGYLGATEEQVIDYYYLPAEEESSNNDAIISYISNTGNINIYNLMEE